MSANVELKRVKEWAWMRGFASLYQKESRAWWSTKRWWINGLVWMGLAMGLVATMIFLLPAMAAIAGQTNLVEQQGGLAKMGLSTFFQLGTLAITIGVIVLCQDLIVSEKQVGLTEGLLAKPVQRKAYVLAKICASLVAILLLVVALPGAAVYTEISLGAGEPLHLQSYLAGMGLLTLSCLFYLTLTIMLGASFNSRSPILGIAIGIFFIGGLLSGMLKPLMVIGPWMLVKYAEAITCGVPIPAGLLWPPILATTLWCVVFTCWAVIRFERMEF